MMFRHQRYRVVAVLVACGGCSAAPRPPLKRPKTGPSVVLSVPRIRYSTAHFLDFKPGLSEDVGLELSVELYDKAGTSLALLKTRVGPRLDGNAIVAGRQVSVRLRKPDLSMRFKVVGGERPTWGSRRRAWRFDDVARVRIRDVRRCRFAAKRWYPGMTLAPGSLVPSDLRGGDTVHELFANGPHRRGRSAKA